MAKPKIRVIHFNMHPLQILKRYCQFTIVIASIALAVMGASTGDHSLGYSLATFFLYSAIFPTAIFLGLSIMKDELPDVRPDFPSEWCGVALVSVPMLLQVGYVIPALIVAIQFLYGVTVWYRSRHKPKLKLPEELSASIEEVLKDVLGEQAAKQAMKRADRAEAIANGKETAMCEHIRVCKKNGETYLTHDLAIMFELASTIGKMVAIMDEDDSKVFMDSFTSATAMERWACENMETVAEKWKAGEIDPKNKRRYMRKYMEDKITARVREANEKKAKVKSNG